jgi:hypothetical protein
MNRNEGQPMKKLIITFVLGLFFASSVAFGQNGYFVFSAFPHTVWDSTALGMTLDADFDAAFLWAPSGDTPMVSSIFNSTPTNGVTDFSYSAAWNDIVNDPNFQFAQSNGVTVVASGIANGAFTYDLDEAIPISGTTPETTYSLYVIAWNNEGGITSLFRTLSPTKRLLAGRQYSVIKLESLLQAFRSRLK